MMVLYTSANRSAFRTHRHQPLSWLSAIVLLTLLAACSSAPGSGSIDGMDLGLEYELHLKDLQRAEAPPADAVAFAKTLFPTPPPLLDSLKVYSAGAAFEDEGEVPLEIWVLPLGVTAGGGRITVAIDPDGRVRRFRIAGNAHIGDAPSPGWENYWRQFEYEHSRAVIPADQALSSSQVDSVWAVLNTDSTEAAQTARLLYEHRLIMYNNNYLIRRTMTEARGQNVPAAEWIDANRDMYDRMGDIAVELRPLIGDSASAKYAQVTLEAREVLDLVAAHTAASEGDAVRERVLAFRRQACGGCHSISPHDAGDGELKDDLFAQLEERGVRRDLYRTGFDVWGVPDDMERSQELADATKAVLVVAGAS